MTAATNGDKTAGGTTAIDKTVDKNSDKNSDKSTDTPRIDIDADAATDAATEFEAQLQQRVRSAARHGRALCMVGGGSKSFYGRTARGDEVHLRDHSGVVRYDAAELVVTARAGMRLADLAKLLAAEKQMVGFEPPQFSAAATLGGAVAAGLAGPRRPYAGGVRDFILGVKMMNGSGDILHFGGQVMKNVAGFDIARLMAGAMGALGVLLEVSMRVAPRPAAEKTLVLAHARSADALAYWRRLAQRPLPVSAAAWQDGETRIRLSADGGEVASAANIIGGEVDSGGRHFWRRLRDHGLPFFHARRPLLRVSLPPAAEVSLAVLSEAAQFLDWGGAQRWVAADEVDLNALTAAVRAVGGHLTYFRGCDGGIGHAARHTGASKASDESSKAGKFGECGEVFPPLAPNLAALHRRLKHAFDPAGILNPGRMYADF